MSDKKVELVVDDDYQKYLDKLPAQKRKRLAHHVHGMRTGIHAIAPMQCGGPDPCLFKKHCPLIDRGPGGELVYGPAENFPIGRNCVMETMYMKSKIEDYYNYLDVDPDNPIEVSIVNELSLLDLYKNRAMMVLSAGDKAGDGMDLLQMNVVAVTEHGNKVGNYAEHPALQAIERLERRRNTLVDKLMESRKAKYEVNKANGLEEGSQLLKQLQDVSELISHHMNNPVALPITEEDDIIIK